MFKFLILLKFKDNLSVLLKIFFQKKIWKKHKEKLKINGVTALMLVRERVQ